MTATDTILVFMIITFLILIIWSKVMNQSMLDTVLEIRDMLFKLQEVPTEKI